MSLTQRWWPSMVKLVPNESLGNDTEQWLPALPSSWAWATLGDVCTHPQYGYTTQASKIERGPRFLRITDLKAGGVDWASVPYCAELPSEPGKYRLSDGDILVAR